MAIGSKELSDFKAALAKNSTVVIQDRENKETSDRDERTRLVADHARLRTRSASRRSWLIVGIAIVVGMAAILITALQSWHF